MTTRRARDLSPQELTEYLDRREAKMSDPAVQAILDRIKPGYLRTLDVPVEWLPALVELDGRLAAIDPDYQLAQVKEKFGGLRYYFDTTSPRRDEMTALVDKLERTLRLPGKDD